MEKKRIKTGQVSRAFKLTTSLASAGAQYLKEKVKEKSSEIISKQEEKISVNLKKLESAKVLIASMGELKGGLMKIGQMLSITEDLLLPKEVSALFKSLQKFSPSMPDSEIDSVFQESFQKTPEQMFQHFDRTPLAAASIGQVHKAILKSGEVVAVKIQYPKIVEAMKHDLSNLKVLEKLFSTIFPQMPDIKTTLVELKQTLLDECDYEKELKEILFFQEIYAQKFPDILVPKVFPDFSSKSILTLEYMEGDSFEESLQYLQEEKNYLGEILYQSFLYSFFEKKCLHTDPQNGNYLFKRNKIILMDFGSTRHFPEDFVDLYSLLVLSIENKDKELFRYVCIELGIITTNDSQDHVEKQFSLIHSIYAPYLDKGIYSVDNLNPFQLLKDFFSSIKVKGRKAPRQEFLLLDRANLGIFSKLKEWKSQVDWEKGRQLYRYGVSDLALKKFNIK